MSKKKDKIGKVGKSDQLKGVQKTENVSEVEQVKKTSGVSGVGRTLEGTRRPTRTMTVAEREKLFGMIQEEAEKLFKDSGLPAAQREVIENAVKIAVDSALVDDSDE